MGRIIETDPRLSCGANPPDFFTLLASCAIVDPVSGDVVLNTIPYTYNEADPAIDCTKGAPMDPERYCAANFFAIDACGNLALKIGYCTIQT